MAYFYFVILQYTWMISTFIISENVNLYLKGLQQWKLTKWKCLKVKCVNFPHAHSIPQHKHVELEGMAMATDLILYNDSRLTLFKTEDIQLKLMEDHLSVDPRKCYNCNWSLLHVNWQFAEISTEEACSATSTNVLRLKQEGKKLHWKSTILLWWPFGKHSDNIHSTHYP